MKQKMVIQGIRINGMKNSPNMTLIGQHYLKIKVYTRTSELFLQDYQNTYIYMQYLIKHFKEITFSLPTCSSINKIIIHCSKKIVLKIHTTHSIAVRDLCNFNRAFHRVLNPFLTIFDMPRFCFFQLNYKFSQCDKHILGTCTIWILKDSML